MILLPSLISFWVAYKSNLSFNQMLGSDILGVLVKWCQFRDNLFPQVFCNTDLWFGKISRKQKLPCPRVTHQQSFQNLHDSLAIGNLSLLSWTTASLSQWVSVQILEISFCSAVRSLFYRVTRSVKIWRGASLELLGLTIYDKMWFMVNFCFCLKKETEKGQIFLFLLDQAKFL